MPWSDPQDPNEPPSEVGAGGGSGVREVLLSDPLEWDDPEEENSAEPPARTVWQKVTLEPGTYVLSWWDQARSDDGSIAIPTDSESTMVVGVYDESWMLVRVTMVRPYAWIPSNGPPQPPMWGPRRTVNVTITQSGAYHVGFAISVAPEDPGSVAIANVQLERVTGGGNAPSAYVPTGLTRKYVTTNCEKLSAEDFRGAFRYECEKDGACFYELSKPLIIDTSDLGKPTSRFNGKIASGNFNLRHITMAVNLVGTGIRECGEDGSMGCYGSGFTEYTVNHDAFMTRIIGHQDKAQKFNFGSAAINHGKALTTKRYITFPVGSADGAMLAQPGIEKGEFRGRPLDGSYRLRIWDNGQIRWDRLEDVQLVLKYRYWSRIDRQPGGK